MDPRVPQVVSGRWTRYVVQALEGIGVDVEVLCARVGVAYPELTDHLASIDNRTVPRLWSEAVAVTGDPNVGLHAAERFRPVANDLFLHLMISSETLGAGLVRASNFFTLAGNSQAGQLIRRQGANVWRETVLESDHYAAVEFRLGAFGRFAQMALQQEVRPLEARFKHPDRGAPRDRYERVYNCPVTFSAAENSLIVSDEVLALRPPTASEETARALEQAASIELGDPTGSQIERQVRALLSSTIAFGSQSESTIAQALHMSERTLRRRLADAGHTFSELLDDVRRRNALDLIVSTPLLLDAIADKVGYGGTRALARAVKRWTGLTPTELRDAGATMLAD